MKSFAFAFAFLVVIPVANLLFVCIATKIIASKPGQISVVVRKAGSLRE